MKRFYLIICFLMSIIGSAWGQETETETFVVAPTTTNEVNAYISNGAKSDDNMVSIQFNTESDNSKKNDEEVIVPNFKLNVQTKNDVRTLRTIVVKPTNGVTITNVKLYGVDSKRNLVVNDTDIEETTSEHTQITPEGVKGNWWVQYSESSTSDITFSPTLKSDLGANNAYIYKVEVTYTYTPITTYDKSFSISDFNYVTNRNASSGLDRRLFGFDFVFSGGDGLKCNATDKLTFRTRSSQNGTLTITPTNEAKIMGAQFTCSSGVIDGETKYFTITDGKNDLTESATVVVEDDNVVNVKLELATGVSKIVFAKKNVAGDATDGNKEFDLSAISLTTDMEMPTDKVTPELSFASAEITTTVGGKVSNALNTKPNNFAVTYTSDNEDVATVDNTGAVNVEGLGTATITANFGDNNNNYYNAASSSYTLSVIEPKTTLNIVDFNYNANTSVNNGLDRTGVDGFDVTFTGDPSTPKFNSYESGLAIGNGGTMTVKAVDEGNTIRYIDFTKASSGKLSAEGIGTNVEGTWSEVDGTVRFTPTTPNQIIVFSGNGNDFAIAAMTICTSAVPANVGSKQTPTITLASNALTAEIGTNATVNSPAVTTVPQNFKVRYKIDEDNNNTGSTIDENTGVVTIGNTPGTITVQAYFNGKRLDGSGNNNELYRSDALVTYVPYTLTITEPAKVYPWTVSDNTLTIDPSKVDGNIDDEGNPKGLLVSGGMSTADDNMDDIPGLSVTLTGDASNQWQIYGNAYGKVNPAVENNIPTTGTYIVLEPTLSGTVTIKTRTYDNHTYTLVDANGNVIKSETPGANSDGYVFNATLSAGTKYYYYISGIDYNLGFSSITYEPSYIAGTAKIWDFRTWSENDIAALGDENNWTSGDDGKYYSNVNAFSAASLGLEAADGLLFTANAGKISPYMPTNSSDGSLRLGGKSVKIALPGLKANQTITISSRTANNSSERGILFNSNAKLELISGEVSSTSNPNIVTYKVLEDVAAGELVMNPSDGLYLYYIQLAEKALPAPSLKWMQGEKDVTDTEISVTAADIANTGITLNNENGVEVTYSSDSDAIVVGADGSISIADGKTVMPGSVITVTASFAGNETYSAYSVSYTMKVEIAYPYTWDFETNTTVSANAEALNNNAYDGCAEAAGLLFTASAGSVEKKDGYLSLDKNGKAVVTIPGLKAGQTVVFKTESAESTDLRGVVCTSGNATLMSGTDANLYGYFSFDVTADGDVTFAESSGNGSVKVYSVTVNAVDVKEHPAVKFVDEKGIEITNQSVLWYHVDGGTHKVLTLKATTAAGAGTVKYEIIEGTNATIDSSTGTVTFNGLGHVVIKASVEATDSHEAGFAIIHAQHKGEDVVKWMQGDVVIDNTTVTARVGAEFVMPTATSDNDLPLLYRSSNERAATIDSDGKITLITGGLSTVITAYHASTDEYNGAYASFTLKVESDIKFLSDVNTLKVNIGSKSGVRFSRPNGLSDIKDAVVTVNGAAADSELANKFFSSLKYEAHASQEGPGLLTVAVNDDETLIGEKVQIVIAENYTANNETQHVISAIVEIEITSADSRNFSWVKKSGKMVKGTFIALPAWTGNAGTNSNKLKTFNNIKKEEEASEDYRSGEFQPVFTSSDESKAIIGYIEDSDIDRKDTLLIYAKEVGTVTIKAADAQNPDLYDEYTLEIVDLESEYNSVVEKMTFPYTWDFTKDYDLSSLAEDSNYWTDKGDRYSGQMGFFNGDRFTQSCTGLNRAYMKVYGDAELMPIFNGLQLCLGNSTPTSKVGRVNLFKEVSANRPRLNMTGGTHTFKLPAIPAERRPETFRVYVKIRSTASVEFNDKNERNSWIFAGDTNNPAEEVRRGPAPGETAIFGFDVDPSKDIFIPCANVDIFWIAASTEPRSTSTSKAGNHMASYTYGKAIDYAKTNESQEVDAYIATNFSTVNKKTNVTLKKTNTSLPAGEGVILKSDAEQAYYMIADGENVEEYNSPTTPETNLLVGTVEATSLPRVSEIDGKNYVNYILSRQYATENNPTPVVADDYGFYKILSKTGITSGAQRSYLRIPEGEEGYGQATANPEAAASSKFALGITFEDEMGEVTGIIEIENNISDNTERHIGGYYNLNGVRINKPAQKGIYIHNGKKMVVK